MGKKSKVREMLQTAKKINNFLTPHHGVGIFWAQNYKRLGNLMNCRENEFIL